MSGTKYIFYNISSVCYYFLIIVKTVLKPSYPQSHFSSVQFSSVQLLSRVRLFAPLWMAACQASLFITNSWSLLRLVSIESVMPSKHLILCCPLLLPPSIFPSIRVFSNESFLRIRWPKYWSFSISPSNEYSGLISFMIDWVDLLTVQGTRESLLQHHSSKTSVLHIRWPKYWSFSFSFSFSFHSFQ